jgi:hypothetical protein
MAEAARASITSAEEISDESQKTQYPLDISEHWLEVP